MRVTETTPLLGEPSSSHPDHTHANNPGKSNYILCPHAPSHHFHINFIVPRSATNVDQDSSDGRLSVIPEEDEEWVSANEEADDSVRGLSMGTDSSDEELHTSQERAVYLQPVMVPIVVHQGDEQILEEEDTWEVGCVSRFCWPLMCLFRKLDTAPDEQDGPRPPAPLSETDSDAEFADDERSSTGSSSAPSTLTPHMALLMPAVRVYGQSSVWSQVLVSSV
ncbi:uncharacterized protein NECHADRAFT_81446 [Fusarium vanettenii 77-13-4]|uniref:Uncharacterized protein n=1 Tax=Fusarium vanettenii (strain ATCC MYA-4622 / CBS 123669 / FGSC 9596 / NRRL 45880 / 77-13-4) TaxID=660122 RepID=C7Z922_FUSV7|nr:uncharacterized protein NECHADRAFT_81446 [Fusarium vanettenii 77-13-4]EEU38947.1 predicted protein [Fusarium vanettenii 77-13-4]